MKHLTPALLLLLLSSPIQAQAQPGGIIHRLGGTAGPAPFPISSSSAPGPKRWFKGNTHAHARIVFPIPHGDSSPRRMATWYKDRGYDFLCLSDHNKVGRERRAKSIVDPGFLMISGTEITSDTRLRLIYKWRNKNAPERIVHTTALNIDLKGWNKKVWREFTPASSVVDILRTHRKATEAAGGISIVNHPNFKGHISAQEIIDSGCGFFELYNSYPHSKNFGSGSRPSTETIWDEVLSKGTKLYAVASDDAHHTKTWKKKLDERIGIRANPGGGWIMVRASSLTPDAIVVAMQAGEFYASSGVHLSDVNVDRGARRVTITVDLQRTLLEIAKDEVREPARSSASAGVTPGVHIEFVSQGGRVVHTVDAASASITFSQVTQYVRARVTYVEGGKVYYAWTQPVFVP